MLAELIGIVCLVYLDDIIVYSTSFQLLIILKNMFTKWRKSNLKIRMDTSEFLHKECTFLGDVISTD